jgi:hypothetical protein
MSIGYIATPGTRFGCGGTLAPVMGSEMARDHNQYDESMNLVFVPGYGEVIDGDQLVDFVFCKVCVKILFEAFPSLEQKLVHYSDSMMTGPTMQVVKLRPEE